MRDDPQKKRIVVKRTPLKTYQLSAFFHDKRYAWIEGTTKCGKTHTAIVWLFEQACTGTFKNYWWVAPTQGASDIAYTRMKDAIKKPLRRTNDTNRTITLPNGRIIWFKSGEKPDNLFGEDVGAAVLDEASRMREGSWWAVRSTLTATRGKLRAIGNVKGRRNWFYKKCRETQAAMSSKTTTDSHWAIITAADAVKAGILPQAEIDDARREYPESVFNELYYGVPTEDGSNPFGMKHIAAVATLDATTGKTPVARGIDVARAVDWTVILGLDADGSTAAFERFQKPWEEFYRDVYEVSDQDRAPSLVDSTGIGDVILSRLQKDRPRRFEGYKFTQSSKQRLMEGLAVAIQRGEIKIPKDGPIRMELEQFEFAYTRTGGVRYSAPEGFHDDCVMALALAVSMFKGREKRMERRVYSAWGDRHELDTLTDYHQKCWDENRVRLFSLVKPQDRKPWAMTWLATFPNSDVIAVAEWPPMDYASARTSPVTDVEDYRAVITETEAAIGMDIAGRRINMEHVPPPPAGRPYALLTALGSPCSDCMKRYPRDTVYEKCGHRLNYLRAEGTPEAGHALVRAAISAPRAKLYALRDACPNLCHAVRNYAYCEDEGETPSAVPEYTDKDFNDLVLALYNAKLHLWPKEAGGADLYRSPYRDRNAR